MIPATQDAATGAASANDSVETLHALILPQLDEDQAQETISIPLAGKSSIADHMVIASGRSTRHVSAIAEKLAQRIKQEAGRQVRVEGLPNADWVLLDAGDVIVHLFRPEVREFYNIEKMWSVPTPGAEGTKSGGLNRV